VLILGQGFKDFLLADIQLVDMSLGHDGIRQSLLWQVLAIERPEFQSQNLSFNKDVVCVHCKLTREQVQYLILLFKLFSFTIHTFCYHLLTCFYSGS